MQTGTITHIHSVRGMFIVKTDDGDFAVFELLSSIEIALGDRVGGNLGGLGGETLTHIGHGTSFSAYGQTGPSSLRACLNIL